MSRPRGALACKHGRSLQGGLDGARAVSLDNNHAA